MMHIRALVFVSIVGSACNAVVGGVEESDGERAAASFSVGQTVEVCGTGESGLRQRSGPGVGYGVLRVMSEGTQLRVIAVQGVWYKAAHQELSGWSHGSFLCTSGPSTPPTPPTPPNPPSTPAPPAAWSCPGSYGTTQASDGNYYVTSFGCWIDNNGVAHGDPGDNCIPACLSEARATGLCASGWSGKTCEQQVKWYVADSGRFGCLQRLRVTNPANGKKVVVVALDAGPACWVEAKVSKAILDMSPPTAIYLFGTSAISATERELVHVVEVSSSTSLGPEP
jgi:hypothetical protein